ncbi:Transthyretin-like family protein [Cooperia oncophora]
MSFWRNFLIYAFLCLGVCWAMRIQGVAVRGTLRCGPVPANHSKVRIVDIDYGIDPDDTLDDKRTDEQGRFELTGTTRELTPIDPVLYIWHECLDEDTPCSRKLKFVIPKTVIIHNGNPTPEQWLDTFSRRMMFPGGVGSSELQQAAAEKVKRDIGTFFIFGFLIEAVAFGASYLNIEGFLV